MMEEEIDRRELLQIKYHTLEDLCVAVLAGKTDIVEFQRRLPFLMEHAGFDNEEITKVDNQLERIIYTQRSKDQLSHAKAIARELLEKETKSTPNPKIKADD